MTTARLTSRHQATVCTLAEWKNQAANTASKYVTGTSTRHTLYQPNLKLPCAAEFSTQFKLYNSTYNMKTRISGARNNLSAGRK